LSIHNLSDSKEGFRSVSTDVCIIGAGMAGLMAARRIAATGRSVVVLESGGLEFDSNTSELNRVEDVNDSHKGAFGGRFRGLGGSSMQWGGRLLPLTRHDTLDRSYIGVNAWPFDIRELDQYQSEIESVFKIDATSYEEDMLDEFRTRGPIPANDPDIVIRSPKWVAFRRCNMGRLLRKELAANTNIDIWINATVVDFDLDLETRRLKSVTGRDADGRKIQIQAIEFMVASGAIEATRLLLLLDASSEGQAFSGIGVLGRYF